MTGISPPNIRLPGVSLHPHRRGRSNSFLKVEHVDSSNEVALDQAAYANINAEWVNRKGTFFLGAGILNGFMMDPSAYLFDLYRRMDDPCRAYCNGESCHRRYSRYDPEHLLDSRQPVLSRRAFPSPLSKDALLACCLLLLTLPLSSALTLCFIG